MPLAALALVVAFAAWIFRGHRKLAQTRQSGNLARRKLLLASLIAGYVGLGYSIWALVFVSRGLYQLGEVDSAIGSLRTLEAAEEKFAEAYPNIGYTCDISQLRPFESPDLKTIAGLGSSHSRNGYEFEVTGCRVTKGIGRNTLYKVTARPLREGMSAFCLNQSGILRYEERGSADLCLKSGQPYQ